MAVQMHVSFSSIVNGAAVFAGVSLKHLFLKVSVSTNVFRGHSIVHKETL